MARQWRGQAISASVVITPLVGGQIVETRGNHLTRWALPVQGECVLCPAIHGTQLLLSDVVSPTATVDALRATHGGQRQEGAVDAVGVEEVVDASAHDDLATAARVSSILGKLTRDSDCGVGRYTGELLLPCRSTRYGSILEVRRPLTRQIQIFAVNGVVRQHDVVDSSDKMLADAPGGDTSMNNSGSDWTVFLGFAQAWQVKARENHFDRFETVSHVCNGHHRVDVVQTEVPLALAIVAIAVSESSAWVNDLAVGFHHQQTVRRILRIVQSRILDIGCSEEFTGHEGAVVTRVELDQERGISVLAHVVEEVRRLLLDVEGLQNDMSHGEGQCAVGTWVDAHPLVGELGVISEVRADDDNLGAVVASLDHEVAIRSTGDRNVRAPHHQVAGVEPVTGLWNVGLVAEGLW